MSHLRRAQANELNSSCPASQRSTDHVRLIFWGLVVVLGLLHVWAHRNDVYPDSISYIELAWAGARFGLHQLVNAYWSPLYPFLLSLVFRFFHPSPQWEFAAVHFLNFGVYLASLASFELFLKELLGARQAAGASAEKSMPLESQTLRIWGYIFFLWASYFWLGAAAVTPDLCVAVLVFLVMALLLRVWRGRGNWLVFAALGALLGLGYLAKAAMFPLSFVFLFSAFFLSRSAGAPLRAATLRALLATGVFAAIALPLVLSLSSLKGRPTFGESGSINYVEYVNRTVRWVHWQGEPPGTGTPVHPTRKIFFDPDVYEFSTPVQGSYPPWYDPSYWYEGARPHFLWKDQLWALFRAANLYLKLFSKSGALWVVLATLLWSFRKSVLAWYGRAPYEWLILLSLVAPFAMYALVHVEVRFMAPFALMLLLWAVAKLRVPAGAPPQLLKRFSMIIILAPALAASWMILRDLYVVIRNEPYEPWIVAQQLHAMGIPPGTQVACVGGGLEAYWAHLAGAQIIADIPDQQQTRFIAADAARKHRVLSLFSSVGAKAVITRNAAAANGAAGWRQIPETHYFIWQEPWAIGGPVKK